MSHKYLDCDFYWVTINNDGEKVIKPYGYGYDAEESADDESPDETCRFNIYYSDFEISLDDLEDEDFDYDEACADNTDEIEDYTEEELFDLLENGACEDEGKPTELPIRQVNNDTPEGWYVNYPLSE